MMASVRREVIVVVVGEREREREVCLSDLWPCDCDRTVESEWGCGM